MTMTDLTDHNFIDNFRKAESLTFDDDIPEDPNILETRFYGGDRTLHRSSLLNVETYKGKVVSVWFRCCALPFDQHDVDGQRAEDMNRMYQGKIPSIHGIEIVDDVSK